MWGLLADPERLRVFAAAALDPGTPEQLALRTGLAPRVVLAALVKLEAGGAVRLRDDTWSVDLASLRRHAQEASAAESPYEEEGLEPRSAAVLRAFVRSGRLVAIPTARAKRLVVLDHVAKVFEPGVRYPEREVDALLRVFHDDHAALRRYLVDECLLARDAGLYWRIGGPVAS
jgi:hypothetical protein